MKDLYSFSKTQEELDEFYEKATQAYHNIFKRVGLGDITYLAYASGGSFGTKYSHEFQTLTSAGEDTIYIHKGKRVAINKEVLNDETLVSLGVSRSELVEEKSVEVGNIYKHGTFYSEPLGLTYKNELGEDKFVVMGSYGIGLGRVMGAIVETHNDERGALWPEEVAPFRVHLVEVRSEKREVRSEAEKLYDNLQKSGVEVLYDDREEVSAGGKFADADLIGCPWRVVVSEKSLAAGGVEVKRRDQKEVSIMTVGAILKKLAG
jgi:prolyl-tRNA synthetase